MKPKTLKWLAALLLGAVVFLQGCISVNSGSIPHGILTINQGSNKIEDVVVVYGEYIFNLGSVSPSSSPPHPNRGMSMTGWKRVPAEMTVMWRTSKDGPVRRVSVPLKVSAIQELYKWKIHFYGEVMEVWREQKGPPTHPHNPWQASETVKIFSTEKS